MFDVLSHKCILDFLSCFCLSVALGKCVKPSFCQRYLLLRLFLKSVRWKMNFLHIHVMYIQLILNCHFIFASVLAYFPTLIPSVEVCECGYLTKEEKKKRYLVANHRVLACSFCWVLSFLGICFQHTNLF